MKQKLLIAMVLSASFLWPAVVAAQERPGTADPTYGLNIWAILATIIYGVIGIALTVAGYFAFDKIAGLDLKRELVEDQNTSLGIMLAGVFIGIAIIISSAIAG